ncbi:hypothetical protein BTH60_03575 [Lactobacillus delbrueckii subsp. bulgaricus]|nr:hypothetical protein [Lactobacillus delbrueckii subsp. bulgaricus]
MHQIENADFLAHLVCQSFFKKIAGKSGKTKRRASQALRVLNNQSYLDIGNSGLLLAFQSKPNSGLLKTQSTTTSSHVYVEQVLVEHLAYLLN